MRSYTLPDVVRKSGATARQIDTWTSGRHLYSPEAGQGSGTPRHWSAVEVDVARLMVRLTNAGFTVKAAGPVARMLVEGQMTRVGLGDGVHLTVAPPPEGYAA